MSITTTRVYRGIEYSYRCFPKADKQDGQYQVFIRLPEQDWHDTMANAAPGDVEKRCREAIDRHYETSGP